MNQTIQPLGPESEVADDNEALWRVKGASIYIYEKTGGL